MAESQSEAFITLFTISYNISEQLLLFVEHIEVKESPSKVSPSNVLKLIKVTGDSFAVS